MFATALTAIHTAVVEYLQKNDPGKATPSPAWTCASTLSILANYPLSVSRPILLTELEARWRSELRRGDHGGKLAQALRSEQLSLDTVLVGTLTRVDAHRCRLVEDGGAAAAAADMILHKQFNDFCAFTAFSAPNMDMCHGRLWSFVQCRLLPFVAGGGSAVLLPTPLGMPHMDVARNPADTHLYNSFFRVTHDNFVDACVGHGPVTANATANATGGANANANVGAALQVSVTSRSSLHIIILCSFCNRASVSSAGKEFLNPDKVVAVLIQVVDIGVSRVDASKASGAAYTVVRVRFYGTDTDSAVILWDHQQRFAAMWRVGMVLLLWRPYVALNRDEALFGASVHVPAALGYMVVAKPAPELAHWPAHAAPVHFLYGGCTAVAVVAGLDDKVTSRGVGASSSSGSSSSGSSSGSGGEKGSGGWVGGDGGALLVRVLGVQRGSSNAVPVPVPVPPIHQRHPPPPPPATVPTTTLFVATTDTGTETAGLSPRPRLLKVAVGADAAAAVAAARVGHVLWLRGLQVCK